jgi:hypothetical protein
MDTITILRDLWRLRVLVALVAVLAVLASFVTLYRVSLPFDLTSRQVVVGVATARILVDTPTSQVVEIAPKGSEMLGVRANLIASLMAEGVVKNEIAQRAGLAPDKLVGITDTATEPLSDAAPADTRANVLKTRVLINTGGAELPIIEVETRAADAASAGRLADAAVSGLRGYLGQKAATEKVPDARRLRVTGLGNPQVSEVVEGPGKIMAILAAIGVFLAGCGFLLLLLAISRGWRAATDRERTHDAAEAAGQAPAASPPPPPPAPRRASGGAPKRSSPKPPPGEEEGQKSSEAAQPKRRAAPQSRRAKAAQAKA